MTTVMNSADLLAGKSGKKRKKELLIIISVFGSILVLVSAAGLMIMMGIVVVGVKSDVSGHAIVKSSCSVTSYPELCYSTISSHPEVTKKVKNQKDVIELAVNITKTAVEKNYFQIKKLLVMMSSSGLTPREMRALHDCLQMVSETLEELGEVEKGLKEYHTKKKKKKNLRHHANDLKTLMSSAITDQETCLDGFSHDNADKNLRKHLQKGHERVEKMCSNALAMICNMTDTDLLNHQQINRRRRRNLLKEEEEEYYNWPEWLSVGDRKLLQSGTVTPNVVVAADGSGDYKTVAAAVAAAPSKSTKRYVIRIKAGVYRENVQVPKPKTNLMFIGDGRKTTIITGSRSVKGGSTTFESATVAIVGDGFLARDITFENTAGASNHQAVALRVGSDLSAFYKCDMLAYQDTLYVHKNRQFYINCFVAGTVDFIFGNAEVVFQDCDIHARRPNSGQKNMVTAQGRTDKNQNTGIVIQKCRIGATSDLQPVQSSFPTYLGRPWKEYSRTVVMQSTISNVINPAGWHEWNGKFALDTLYYGEYQNTGPGAGTSARVKWKGFKVITTSSEAQAFTPGNFVAGATWLRNTGFPFSLGL